MKKVLTMLSVFTLVIVMSLMPGCGNKEQQNTEPTVKEEPTVKQPEKKQIGFNALSELIGSENALKCFEVAGLTEDNPTKKGAKQAKANATLAAWLEDITLNGSPSALTYSVSPNAYIGGVTRFGPAPITNDGAIGLWDCGRRWDNVPADPTVTCSDPSPISGETNYRAFTADKVTYDVHISPLLKIVQ